MSAELIDRLATRKQELFDEQLRMHSVSALPGAFELLQALRAAGVKVAVATASRNARNVLVGTGMLPLLDALVDGSDAGDLELPSKPSPALFREACRRLDETPSRTLVV